MADGLFQTPFEPTSGFLGGTIKAEVFEGLPSGDPTDPKLLPKYIISTDDAWQVKVDWTLSGILVPMIGGTWELKVHLETIGPGIDKTFPVPIAQIPLDGSNAYSKTLEFVKGDVGKGEYDLVAVLTYKDLGGGPGPLAGNVKLPMLQFYEP